MAICINDWNEDLKTTLPPATPEYLLSPSQWTNGDTTESSSNVWSDIASSCDSTNECNEVSIDRRPHIRNPHSGPLCHSHIVLFYYAQEYLYNCIASFAVPCLAGGGGAIIIATHSHMIGIVAKLQERQIDVEKKKQNGHLVFIDAHEALSALQTTDCKISEQVFHNLIEKPIQNIVKRTNGVLFGYGELPDILGQRREYHSALELESKWDGFMERQNIQLLCGYDMKTFVDASDADIMKSVCRQHTHIDDADVYNETDKEAEKHRMTIELLKHKAKTLELELKRRKVAEAALHASLRTISQNAQSVVTHERDRYRNVLSTLPVGVYGVTFGDDEAFYVNSRFCELVGRNDSEIRNCGWIDLIHPDDRQEMETDWPFCYDNDCLKDITLAKQQEYRLVPNSHSIIWVKAETAPTCADDGHVLGYIHTIMDITELKLTEKGRLEAKQAAEEHQRHRAEEAEKHKMLQDQWIDSLCHELRNPLNGISGNVELMENSIDVRKSILGKPTIQDTDIQTLREQLPLDEESILAITNCVGQQKVITDDVLNLSKLELGKVELNKVDFNLNKLLIGIIGMFQAEANSNGLTLSTNLDDACSNVQNDPQRLSQVVINLLVNAIKFTETGTVTVISSIVETDPTYNIIRISIQDTGVGMSEIEKANLFQRFEQPTSKNTFHEYGGSGLGLYISKNLVELMEGSIQVESQKGKGSTFSFTFKDERAPKDTAPLFSSTALSNSPMSSPPNDCYITNDRSDPPSSEASTKKKIQEILLVEDNEVNQRMMLRLLQMKGYNVLVAQHGREAVSYLESTSVDLVIMDIQMPVMDGITATKEIRKIEQQKGREPVPIIGLSGNAREFHATNALQNGLNLYMTKPLKRAELYAALEMFEDQ